LLGGAEGISKIQVIGCVAGVKGACLPAKGNGRLDAGALQGDDAEQIDRVGLHGK
jgi:hypothetical protein